MIPSATIPYAVEDVKRALSWAKTSGRRVLESAAVRELVNAGRHSSGPILGSYLAESSAGRPPQQPGALEAHDFLVGLVAAADAPWNFRLPILVHEVNELAMHDAAPTSFRAALVLAMFAVLGEPPSPLQEPIRQAYLNNAVFDRDGKPRIAARMAITSPAQRGRVEAALASGGLTAEQTLRWRRWLDEQ